MRLVAPTLGFCNRQHALVDASCRRIGGNKRQGGFGCSIIKGARIDRRSLPAAMVTRRSRDRRRVVGMETEARRRDDRRFCGQPWQRLGTDSRAALAIKLKAERLAESR